VFADRGRRLAPLARRLSDLRTGHSGPMLARGTNLDTFYKLRLSDLFSYLFDNARHPVNCVTVFGAVGRRASIAPQAPFYIAL